MKATRFKFSAVAFLLCAGAGIRPATAGLVTLSSPDNKWSLSSDEFGAFGEAVPGSFARRDFGAGQAGYAWASGVLLSDGANRQWLVGDSAMGLNNLVPMAASNVVADGTVGSVRTSTFVVPGFADVEVTLTQSVTNSGISQQYVITNNQGGTLNLSLTSFQDVDLDGGTFLNDNIASVGSTLRVSESGRNVFFSPSPLGYAGFLAGYVAGGGVTGGLDTIGYANSGIPAAFVNQFRDVNGGVIGANMDVNLDLVSDVAGDVGYLFQNNISILSGGSVSLTFGHLASPIPEPSAALLGLLAVGLTARRRRQS